MQKKADDKINDADCQNHYITTKNVPSCNQTSNHLIILFFCIFSPLDRSVCLNFPSRMAHISAKMAHFSATAPGVPVIRRLLKKSERPAWPGDIRAVRAVRWQHRHGQAQQACGTRPGPTGQGRPVARTIPGSQ